MMMFLICCCDYPHDKGYKQLHIRLGIVNTRVLFSVLLTLTLKGIKLKILRSLSYFHNSCARCWASSWGRKPLGKCLLFMGFHTFCCECLSKQRRKQRCVFSRKEPLGLWMPLKIKAQTAASDVNKIIGMLWMPLKIKAQTAEYDDVLMLLVMNVFQNKGTSSITVEQLLENLLWMSFKIKAQTTNKEIHFFIKKTK